MSEQNCPSKDELYLFLKEETSTEQRDEIELHLAKCANCRQNLSFTFSESFSELQDVKAPKKLVEQVKELPNKNLNLSQNGKTESNKNNSVPWYRRNLLQIAFAASLLIFAGIIGVYVLQFQNNSPSDDVLRNGSTNKSIIQLLIPENNAEISAEEIKFTWSEIDEAKNYTLVLSDEKGDIIKEIKTDAPSIEKSFSEIGISQGRNYFWQVKAKLKDGLSSESETRKFSTTEK